MTIPDHIVDVVLRALYRVRRVSMRHTFVGRPSRLDLLVRRVCELAIDALEMWEYRRGSR